MDSGEKQASPRGQSDLRPGETLVMGLWVVLGGSEDWKKPNFSAYEVSGKGRGREFGRVLGDSGK